MGLSVIRGCWIETGRSGSRWRHRWLAASVTGFSVGLVPLGRRVTAFEWGGSRVGSVLCRSKTAAGGRSHLMIGSAVAINESGFWLVNWMVSVGVSRRDRFGSSVAGFVAVGRRFARAANEKL